MSKKVLVLLVFAILMLGGVSIFPAPIGSTTWGTVNVRSGLINDLTTLMVSGNGNGANGLAIAISRQAEKANEDLAQLYALDTTQLTDEEMADYTETLAYLNVVLTNAKNAFDAYGIDNSSITTTFSSLCSLVQYQADNDIRFCQSINQPHICAPVGALTWGTTGFKC